MLSTVRTCKFDEEVEKLNLKFKRIKKNDSDLVTSYLGPESKESRVDKAKYMT